MSDAQTELESLRERADLMGLKYHPRAGVEKLKEAINAKLTGESDEDEASEADKKSLTKRQTREVKRKEVRKEAGRLIRFTLSCNDPQFSSRGGIMKEVGNSLISFKKFIPFDTAFHAPKIIVDHLKSCTYTKSVESKDKTTGRKVVKYIVAKQFVLDILEPLTQEQLKDLALEQARTGSLED